MGQIVKGEKKGRPSKADLARRAALVEQTAAPTAEENDRRRSLRRRNVRYNNFIDYDDYVDEFEDFFEEEEEDEALRKEKKVKLVLNLHEQNQERLGNKTNRKRVLHTRVSEPRGRIVSEEEDEDEDQDDEEEEEEDPEHRRTKQDHDSIPGTPCDNMKQMPLPDEKSLELILDKLQKKDTYGVYAEPVDLEELPDYLDVIDHPMDFATVRTKLSNGSYVSMEQFESDVFLICSNAMQYNSSDTIYYKQARTIQELATKKFQKLRIETEPTEKDTKSDKKTKSNLLLRKQGKKGMFRPYQDPVGSDFSSGATLATQAETGYEMNMGNSDSSGKGTISRFARKPTLLEDRRSTYNMSCHSGGVSESVLGTFNSEIKQLVALCFRSVFMLITPILQALLVLQQLWDL